ncbi:hypothetical protein H0X09_02895 [Candidatus Saccharibacteria bacterium]|nr:hypothetical protein [Candidatus Saccharibacteria bacterium]
MMVVFKKGLRLAFILTLLALPVLIWWKFDYINDWWRLRGYVPPREIVLLADRTTMTDDGRRIFYVNHPKLISQIDEFRKDCLQSEQTIVLGCYYSPQRGIAVYDVSDPRLEGVEEVTSAHEMLHAAYDRLDSEERDNIDKLLNNFYSQNLNDSRIEETISLYRKTEPNDLINEMHSIFATEVSQLPAELESYYSRYFKNRAEVVRIAQIYEKEFTSREQRAKELLEEINSLKSTIEVTANDLEADRNALESQRSTITSQEEASSFNQRVNRYNSRLARYRELIEKHNLVVEQYNDLIVEQQELRKAIDTRPVPQLAQ